MAQRKAARPKTKARKRASAPQRKPKATPAATRRLKPAKARPRARAGEGPPKLPADAELVVRQGFAIDATGKWPQAVPEVILLGNRAGLQYLADVFAHLAAQAGARGGSSEAGEEVRLVRLEEPINKRLSDELEFRFAPLTDANRAATFKRFGINMASRQRGSLFERYREVAELHFGRVVQRLAYDERRERSQREREGHAGGARPAGASDRVSRADHRA